MNAARRRCQHGFGIARGVDIFECFCQVLRKPPHTDPGKPSDICQRTSAMTDSILHFPSSHRERRPASVSGFRDRDDGVLADMLQNGGLFADLSLERWLDRIERREDRA
jgi:hypothetical protein